MNTVVTSKEAILAVSCKLIQEKGWKAVSIRTVAAACDISVGSIYNYFDSKSDLIAETVESVWHDIFHLTGNCTREAAQELGMRKSCSGDGGAHSALFPTGADAFESYADCVKWAFACMKKGDEKYPGFFTLHSVSFIGEEKTSGHARMTRSWAHIQDALYQILVSDPNVRPDAFDESFTPRTFVSITFSLLISALLKRDYDCTGILEMIRRVIY